MTGIFAKSSDSSEKIIDAEIAKKYLDMRFQEKLFLFKVYEKLQTEQLFFKMEHKWDFSKFLSLDSFLLTSYSFLLYTRECICKAAFLSHFFSFLLLHCTKNLSFPPLPCQLFSMLFSV